MVYKGEKTREISFPVGGIGTGCIGLSGNGRLIDWEIFNRPNKISENGASHFAVKAEQKGEVLDTRILNSDYIGSYMGRSIGKMYEGYGFGIGRNALTGMPHFRDSEFVGEFPIAKINFIDDTFPGKVSLTAFNPFIPTNDKDSTIPAAFYEVSAKNTTNEPITYTFCLTVNNPLPTSGAINEYIVNEGVHMIRMHNKKLEPASTEYGEVCIATDSNDISYQEYHYRGSWFDSLGIFWRDFSSYGKFKNRNYPYNADGGHWQTDLSSITASVTVAPGEEKKARFIISWSFPNCHTYWKKDSKCECEKERKTWKNYYAVLFNDAIESATYSIKNWDWLEKDTLLFKDSLFGSTMPDYVIDAISANMSILKSPTVLRLEDGEFYGWEGCHSDQGSCEGSCTHVWNYAYALPYLFPALERSMHELDYKYNLRDDGGMPFRLQLPKGSDRADFRPCADGQFGNIMKTYRDWKVCGDTEWLRKLWPSVKKAIEFAWSETNIDLWDPDKSGILTGSQHHTLDMELFGPNAWLTGFYLGALKAGAEMATALGDEEAAKEYSEIFERGRLKADKELWNGEYYIQKIDLKDKSILEKFNTVKTLIGHSTVDSYWNSESNEIKYQMGEGTAADQLLAQWHANISGLGQLFDKEQTKTALKSMFKYNYKKQLRDVVNPCRIYAINDESGTVICDWPKNVYKPITPAPYSEECWPGIEYAVSSLMIQEGLLDEGLTVAKAVRDRFDGTVRNPWNEFECGSNYARSMSSYSMLLALSGFSCDLVNKTIGFSPVVDGDCEFFFSVDSGWGSMQRKGSDYSLKVKYGQLSFESLELPKNVLPNTIAVGDKEISFKVSEGAIAFDEMICLKAGDVVVIKG